MNKRPKVLMIMHMPPPVHGASMVGQYIHDSEYISGALDCRYINPTTAEGLQDIGKFRLSKITSYLHLLKSIRSEILSFRPDVVYFTANCHGAAFIKDWFIVALVKRLASKVVLHFHNKGVRNSQDNFLFDMMYRKFFKGVKVMLLSELLYEDVKKYVSHDDVLICPNGVPDIADPCVSEQDRKESDLLFLSNLIETKGVTVLLDALELLKKKGIRFNCSFVGAQTKEIDAAAFARMLSSRGLEDSVSYLGKMYGKDKAQQFARSGIFVFPTYYHNECFPLVLLEAMQNSLACVSTCEGAIPELVEDGVTGILIRNLPGQAPSAEALAEAVGSLLSDPERCRQMGTLARCRYEQKYTLEAFERKFVGCIEKALD